MPDSRLSIRRAFSALPRPAHRVCTGPQLDSLLDLDGKQRWLLESRLYDRRLLQVRCGVQRSAVQRSAVQGAGLSLMPQPRGVLSDQADAPFL